MVDRVGGGAQTAPMPQASIPTETPSVKPPAHGAGKPAGKQRKGRRRRTTTPAALK